MNNAEITGVAPWRRRQQILNYRNQIPRLIARDLELRNIRLEFERAYEFRINLQQERRQEQLLPQVRLPARFRVNYDAANDPPIPLLQLHEDDDEPVMEHNRFNRFRPPVIMHSRQQPNYANVEIRMRPRKPRSFLTLLHRKNPQTEA